MKIAYLVIAYMDPEQLGKMAERLSRSSDVYIHINANVDITPFQNALKETQGRVVLMEKRYPVVWAGYSILKATFAMLEEALHYDKYDRIILLTGLDYPIKSDQEILEFFQDHAEIEYLHALPANSERFDHLSYYTCNDRKLLNKFLKKVEKLQRFLKIKGKADYVTARGKKYPLYGTSPKWALTGACANYLLEFYKSNQKFNHYFQFMHAPDDFYVATVVANSKFKTCIDEKTNLFKIIWLPEDKGAKILTEEDYEELIECQQLYAKKFQSEYSVTLEMMLENTFTKK